MGGGGDDSNDVPSIDSDSDGDVPDMLSEASHSGGLRREEGAEAWLAAGGSGRSGACMHGRAGRRARVVWLGSLPRCLSWAQPAGHCPLHPAAETAAVADVEVEEAPYSRSRRSTAAPPPPPQQAQQAKQQAKQKQQQQRQAGRPQKAQARPGNKVSSERRGVVHQQLALHCVADLPVPTFPRTSRLSHSRDFFPPFPPS